MIQCKSFIPIKGYFLIKQSKVDRICVFLCPSCDVIKLESVENPFGRSFDRLQLVDPGEADLVLNRPRAVVDGQHLAGVVGLGRALEPRHHATNLRQMLASQPLSSFIECLFFHLPPTTCCSAY